MKIFQKKKKHTKFIRIFAYHLENLNYTFSPTTKSKKKKKKKSSAIRMKNITRKRTTKKKK
jgi:hypothetical protein